MRKGKTIEKILLLLIIFVITGFIPSLFAENAKETGFDPASIQGKDAAESFEKFKKLISMLDETITFNKAEKQKACPMGKAIIDTELKKQEKERKDACKWMTETIKESVQNLSSETDATVKAEKSKELKDMLAETEAITSKKAKGNKKPGLQAK